MSKKTPPAPAPAPDRFAQERRRFLAEGASRLLLKPFDESELMALL